MKKILFLLLLIPSLVFGQATGKVINDKPSGGSIGSAATTVDVLTTFNLNQTTAGQTLTIPNLTNASAGKIIYVNNVGSVQLTLNPGGILPIGYGVVLRWTGASWSVTSPPTDLTDIETHLDSLSANKVAYSDTVSTITTHAYLDSVLIANSIPAPVIFAEAATTASLTVTYSSNTLTATTNVVLPAQDGYTLNVNEKLVVKDQPSKLQNGNYYVVSVGVVGVSPYILVRDSLYDETDEVFPSQINVLNGTVNGNKFFLQKTPYPTIGASPIVLTSTTAPVIDKTSPGSNLIKIPATDWRSTTSMWVGGNNAKSVQNAPTGAVVPTGKVHRFVSSAGVGRFNIDQIIAINPNQTYYGKIWAARISGSGLFYAGYIAYDKNLQVLSGNTGSYGYFIASSATPASTGTWYYGKIYGQGTATNQFPVGTRFIKPLILVNYNTTGTMDVGGFEISDVPFESNSTKSYEIATKGVTGIKVDSAQHVTMEGVTSTGATGTGNQVYSASPTLTGTVTAIAVNTASVTVSASAIVPTVSYPSNTTDAASTAYITTAIAAIPESSGILGIANASGVYTYYATYTLAMAAATAGQTIEQFADITETGAVEITYKDGVNIDGHGHSYTLSNAGNYNAFSHNTAGGLNMSVINLMVIRTTAGYQCFKIGATSTGTFDFSGSLFTSTGAGNALQCFGAVKISNANCISNSGSSIYIVAGSLNNSYGISTSAEGIYTEATLYNCKGQSGTGKGITTASGTAISCIGVSTSSYGIYVNGGDVIDCKGITTSSTGMWIDNTASSATNCTGVSVSGTGIYLLRNKSMTNLTAISSSGYAVRVGYSGTVNNLNAISATSGAVFCDSNWDFYGGSFTSLYNNAAGYAITGNGGATGVAVTTIVGVTLKCANASAPYIYNNGVAIAIKMKGNNFFGGATTNANITSTLYGRATLVAGTITVNTAAVTSISNIRLTAQTLGTITVPVGYAVSARTAATSFTILSGDLTDTSIIAWEIEEPNN